MIASKLKLLLTAIPLLAGCALFGQGSVRFENAGGGLNAPITNGLTGLRVGGTDYVAALYYAPGINAPEASLIPLNGTSPFSSASPGYFFGGVRVTDTNTAPGSQATFQVRAWEAALGSTYEAALANAPNNPAMVIGKSGLFVNTTGMMPAAATLANLRSFTLNPMVVPEPSLVGVAGLALLVQMFRKRTST